MVKWLARWSRDLGSRPGWVSVLRSWEKHFTLTLTMPVFTQEYKGVLENFQESLMKCFLGGGGGGRERRCPCNGLASYPGGSIANLVTLCYRHILFYFSNTVTAKLRSHVGRTNNF